MTDDGSFFFPAQPSILRAGPSCAEQEEIWSYMTVPPVPFCEEERAPLPDFGKRTPFDPFDGFTITGGGEQPKEQRGFRGLRLDAPARFVAPKAL